MQNWEYKKLGETCEFLDSKRKPITANKREAGPYPYYGATGILDYVKDYLFDEELILLGEDGAKWDAGDNSAFLISGKTWVNNHAHVLRPNSNVYSNWIIYFLNYSNLMKYVKGATVPKLNQENARSIEIPLPPLEEQKRIVKILDEKFAQLETVKANAKTNLQNAKDLFQSQLTKAFSNTTWEKKRLDEITEVKDGTHDSPSYCEVGIPFVTQKNITSTGFDFTNTKKISLQDHEKFYKRSNVEYGDIIIAMIGANRGISCIVTTREVFSIKNVGLIKKSENINQDYLAYYLKSDDAKNYISEASNGGAQEFVGLTSLRCFPIPLPPLSEQKRIVEQLDSLRGKVRSLEEIYTKQLANCDELKQSLLKKAFDGEL